ncbi:hypothetical protein D3C86_2100630 [compost metagenome]
MSEPMLTILTWSSDIPFLARSARSRMTEVGMAAIVLPIISWGLAIGFALREK